MRKTVTIALVAASSLALSACGSSGGSGSGSRDYIRAVGSSTVYPFATAVAEEYAKTGGKSPVVEATGTGAGMKLFCAGVGAQHPDIETASRRIKKSEYELCQKNGVAEIVEVQVGIDGIAFAEAKSGPGMKLTPEDVYKAIAANPYGKPNQAKSWKDVNPALPDMPILVYGPPSTSGTRDALAELILTAGCKTDPATAALKESDEDKFEAICTQVREDGAYVDAGENDNLIVQKISQNPKAVGVFGYSFLEANPDALKGIPMSGVEPTYETISDFSYPGARPLYIYVKKAHVGPISGLGEYVATWPKVWGPDGLLKSKGMVISPQDVRARNAEVVANMTPLDPSALK
ncbi:substrate-binding domain-containing protein [Novosphingobium sp. M1R2S20]|uniref:Substrate-binding domain-containing protein n=1 Tax=Novosphingobium rhizovicinum TaxID=3228928 RepID=A0ABV3RDR8_9SPHN